MTEAGSDDDDLPIIDVRSPAERMGESAQAAFGRWQDEFASSRALATIAVLWMLALASAVGTSAYTNFNVGVPVDAWTKFYELSRSGGYGAATAALAGLALAALAGSRIAAGLGALIGVWIMFVGGCGIAVSFHKFHGPVFFVSNRFATGLASLGTIVSGAIVVVLAVVLLGRPVEVVELS